jgi:hypothetical protein
MNKHLITHIDEKITIASNFVNNHMPIDITVDQAYEEMLACNLNSEVMIKAFREAVKFLPPASNFRKFNFILSDKRIASIQIRFNPTDKWPAFLIPEGSFTVNPESKFAALLSMPIRVATEWESLFYVWTQLRSFDDKPATLAYLMPWIRECLADFDVYSIASLTRTEHKVIDSELATVMHDVNVMFFPRMSKQLSAVARSGKTLFGQFRMLEAAFANDTLERSLLTVERTPSLLEPWLKEHMTEAREEWVNDVNLRATRSLEERRKRDEKKFLTQRVTR